jgi:hypothetical protein
MPSNFRTLTETMGSSPEEILRKMVVHVLDVDRQMRRRGLLGIPGWFTPDQAVEGAVDHGLDALASESAQAISCGPAISMISSIFCGASGRCLMATLFFVNPSFQSAMSSKASPVVNGLVPPWLPALTVRSDFLLWTRSRRISPSADFILLIQTAISLGASASPQMAKERR